MGSISGTFLFHKIKPSRKHFPFRGINTTSTINHMDLTAKFMVNLRQEIHLHKLPFGIPLHVSLLSLKANGLIHKWNAMIWDHTDLHLV